MPKKKQEKEVKKKVSNKKEFYIERSSSGATSLDNALGGGFPFGKMVNIIGDKSSGKTLLASQIIAEAYYKYGNKLKWIYDDVEAGYSFDSESMQNIGIKIVEEQKERIGVFPSHRLEDFSYNLKKAVDKIKDDEYLIYVIDSFDALTCQAEIDRDEAMMKAIEEEKDIDKGGYKIEKPKVLGEFFRLRVQDIKYKKCMLIVISQTRQNIGVTFGAKYSRNGGSALDFYAAIIMWLAEAEKERKLGEVVSVCIKARITKNKVGKPFRNAFFTILYDYGIDNIASSIDYLYDLRSDKGALSKKAKLKWDGKEYTRTALIKYIEDSGLEEELKKRTIKKYQDILDKIAPKRKSRK